MNDLEKSIISKGYMFLSDLEHSASQSVAGKFNDEQVAEIVRAKHNISAYAHLLGHREHSCLSSEAYNELSDIYKRSNKIISDTLTDNFFKNLSPTTKTDEVLPKRKADSIALGQVFGYFKDLVDFSNNELEKDGLSESAITENETSKRIAKNIIDVIELART